MRLITALVLALALSVSAARAQFVTPAFPILPAGQAAVPVLTTGQSFTTSPIPISTFSKFGFDWSVVTASGNPCVNVILLQCNVASGTFTRWSPLDGSTVNTSMTITSANGGTSCAIAPSSLVKLQVVNCGTVNCTPTLRGFVR